MGEVMTKIMAVCMKITGKPRATKFFCRLYARVTFGVNKSIELTEKMMEHHNGELLLTLHRVERTL